MAEAFPTVAVGERSQKEDDGGDGGY